MKLAQAFIIIGLIFIVALAANKLLLPNQPCPNHIPKAHVMQMHTGCSMQLVTASQCSGSSVWVNFSDDDSHNLNIMSIYFLMFFFFVLRRYNSPVYSIFKPPIFR